MSNIFHLNLNCKEPIPDVPTILSKPNKRWHLALHPLLNEKRKESSKLPVTTPSFVALNVKPDAFSSIDQTSLTAIVKEKNLDLLLEFGGVESVADALETDVKNGICGAVHDIALRQEVFGSNTYQTAKSLFHFVMEPFKDLTILILLLCATLSLGSGIKEHGLKEGWYDGGSIFAAVLLIISVSTLSNFRHNRLLEKLSKVSNNIKVDVVRNGRRQQISIFEIVVGDVVCLKISDQVPADGLFLDGHPLQVDESSMTGESDHVEVNSSQNPFLFSGTKVADGSAQMLVTSVGVNTTCGQMMSTISRDTNDQTPLQARLKKLTSSTGVHWQQTKAVDMVNSVVRIIAAAVTIVVVAMPRRLVVGCHAHSCLFNEGMMADQTMVRKLSACETMGSVTTICTDKTGTLTLNQMKDLSSSYLVVQLKKQFFHGAVLELDMDMEILKQTCTILHVEAFKSEKKKKWGFNKELDDDERMIFEQIIQGMAASSLRCIALHITRFQRKSMNWCRSAKAERRQLDPYRTGRDKDPCRPGVRKAVEDCQCAGVNVKMIPCLKQKGHVVAVTGDGTNDAPALKEAHIGLSMGIQGTKLLKESSDIIVLDDNFTSVATVLRWGRCCSITVSRNSSSSTHMNVAALVINAVAVVSAREVPFTVLKLLWVSFDPGHVMCSNSCYRASPPRMS
ncbi:putative calcium-transporting ATPase 13, plasma membrane-type [Vitis vinifera]|uniref:Putative calcium-transporting ATPase 13, plasma membrane-type n=1 Tax=Vitis vinifera TaxID=29760 RepID=A0A438KKM6_VITVI|nr:putative calcium-transporting ATPase 13, plasma membrane-type [Vitis vinifera]